MISKGKGKDMQVVALYLIYKKTKTQKEYL